MWFCCCFTYKNADSVGSKGSKDSNELVEPILNDWTGEDSNVAYESIAKSINNKTVAWASSPMCETTYSKEEYDRKIDTKQIAKNKEERKLEKEKQKEEKTSTCFKTFCSKLPC
jgi:hypothetical protein